MKEYLKFWFNWFPFGMKPSTPIERYRVAAGLSQSDLARVTDLSQPMISRWEAGLQIPTPEQVVILINELEIIEKEAFIKELLFPILERYYTKERIYLEYCLKQ